MVAVVHEKVKCRLLSGDKPLTVEEAKSLLGWQSEADGPKAGFGSDFLFKDENGEKIRLLNNQTNRPLRRELAMRYALEMIRGKWALNGETIVVDRHGKIQSGQHRLVGLILAEQYRQNHIKYCKEKLGLRGAVTIEALIVEGISDKADTVDTLDIGQKRSLGDVFFRNHTFKGKEVTDRASKKLANILSYAVRLVWLRQGGKLVSDAPHFPHSEALEMVKRHPRIVEAVQWVYNENGEGAESGKISNLLSMGYAAALMYLMAVSGTEREEYDETGAVDDSNWAKAEKFWSLLASGANLKPGSPILVLRNLLPKIDASGAMGRDEICGSVAKAFAAWMDGEKEVDAKDIKVKRTKDAETGKIKLAETPRLGGIDVEVEAREDAEPGTTAQAKPWEAGDTAWVNSEGEPWFGTVVKLTKPKNGEPMVTLTAKEDGEDYMIPVSCLSADKPELVEA